MELDVDLNQLIVELYKVKDHIEEECDEEYHAQAKRLIGQVRALLFNFPHHYKNGSG